MLPTAWAHRLVVVLLAAGFGWLLPAHHHGLGSAPPRDDGHGHPRVAAAEPFEHHDGGHHADEHGHAPDGHHGGDDGDHPSGCAACHAVRTLYAPVAAALPLLAPQAVTAALPPDADQLVSVRHRPTYHGRAPPAAA